MCQGKEKILCKEAERIAVSVIIPVYNTEDTIKRCVHSVLNQTFVNYEIILVDDGSTDHSPYICDLYEKRKNVKVVHKKNGGLGSARNAGIDVAAGEYVCFVDSDDYIERNYLEAMYAAVKKENVDMVISGYKLKRKKCFIDYSPQKIAGIYSGSSYYRILLEYAKGNAFFYYSTNKLLKRSKILEYELRFSDRHCAEDMLFNAQYYRHSSSLAVIPECVYVYILENGNSLSSRRRDGFWPDMKMVYDAYQDIYEGFSNSRVIQNRLDELILILLRNSFSNYISNEKFSLNDSRKYIKKCCDDLIVRERIHRINPTYETQKILKRLIINKKYGMIAFVVRFKVVLKKRCFVIFNLLRKNN